MNISPISINNNSPSFHALKYQNGVRTGAGLSTELKGLLTKYDPNIKDMKNIDILVMDGDVINLGIKMPRFLSEKYERFFKEKNYDTVRDGEQSSFIMTKGSMINKLTPDKVPGIYNVFYNIPDTEEWKPSYPLRTLEIAKSLDPILQDIDDTENRFGMNCVEVLDNLEEMRKEQERLNLVEQVKNAYTTNNEFKNMNMIDLGILLENKDKVANIKNYGIVMDEVNFPYPVLIQDKNNCLDDIFNDYYKEKGWRLERYSDGFNLHPVGEKYPDYSLIDKGEQKYHVYMDFYEGGSNLGAFGESHFKSLVKLMQILDEISESIVKR